MKGRTWLLASLALGLVVLVVAVTSAVSWLLGRQHALSSLAFVDVSPSTAAQAMQEDHFYADYGDKVLVIRGTVNNVRSTPTGSSIQFHTDSAFGLSCALAKSATTPALSGEVVSVVAPGGSALRQPTSVELPNCRLMSAP